MKYWAACECQQHLVSLQVREVLGLQTSLPHHLIWLPLEPPGSAVYTGCNVREGSREETSNVRFSKMAAIEQQLLYCSVAWNEWSKI